MFHCQPPLPPEPALDERVTQVLATWRKTPHDRTSVADFVRAVYFATYPHRVTHPWNLPSLKDMVWDDAVWDQVRPELIQVTRLHHDPLWFGWRKEVFRLQSLWYLQWCIPCFKRQDQQWMFPQPVHEPPDVFWTRTTYPIRYRFLVLSEVVEGQQDMTIVCHNRNEAQWVSFFWFPLRENILDVLMAAYQVWHTILPRDIIRLVFLYVNLA